MDFTRIIKRYRSGDDVLYVKQRLLALGYLQTADLPRFGNDSYKAVRAFQAANNLDIDGIVGELTWRALFPVDVVPGSGEPIQEPVRAVTIPSWYTDAAARAIGTDLAQVSELRREICLDALLWATDPAAPGSYPRSFYIRGGNLYNKDLSLNIMTPSKLASYFSRQDYAPYYSDGRMEMMQAAAIQAGYAQPGADCSGGVVGLMRKYRVYEAGFDANANTLYNSHCAKTTKPKAGDWAWKNGHIGLVVGGGYVVEWAGGAYGCQLTSITNRRTYNYVTRSFNRPGAWSAFGDPKRY